MKLIERIRQFIDGENADSGPIRDEAPSHLREGDVFAVQVVQRIGSVMEQEMFSPPGAIPRVPQKFFIFVSNETNREWLGLKRTGLIEWLHVQAAIRARALTREQYNPKSFDIELRIDATLAKDEYRVQQIWDAPGPKTKKVSVGASQAENDSNVRTMFGAGGR